MQTVDACDVISLALRRIEQRRGAERLVADFLPDLLDYQADAIATAGRFNVLSWGRRSGKTTLGEDRAGAAAVDGQPAGWFSPTYKMLLEVWREMRDMLRPITTRASVQERRIELVTGGVVEFWSLENPEAARGRKYARVIVDEAAMVPDLLDVWHAIIRPTLIDLGGDAWILSTPRGRNGFWRLFQNADSMPDWRASSIPTSRNHHIDPAELELARGEMPEDKYRQEILAEFLESDGVVFRGVLEAVADVGRDTPIAGHQYLFGVDWGKVQDWTVITVLDVTAMEVVALDRFQKIDYVFQCGRLKALFDIWRPEVIIAETNAMGEPIVEQLQREDLPVRRFTTTNATKAKAIESLSLAFERSTIKILDNPVLISELQAMEATRTPSGLTRYAAPTGMHDDAAMSLAFAWSGAVSAPRGKLYA